MMKTTFFVENLVKIITRFILTICEIKYIVN